MNPGAWRTLLLSVCAITAIAGAAEFLAGSGLGGAPAWMGLWGNTLSSGPEPFYFSVRSIDPGRASDRAGLRQGDLIDIRKGTLIDRFGLFGQPLSGRPVTLGVRRGSAQEEITVTPLPVDFPRRWDGLLIWPGMVWIALFASLIAWRRSHVREMRLLSLALVSLAFWIVTDEHSFAAPWTWLYVVLAACNVFGPLSVALWAASASCLVAPLSRFRQTVLRACYALVAVSIVLNAVRLFGIITLRVDPIALSRPDANLPLGVALLAALTCGALAVAASARADRQRAIWLTVPPAVLFFALYAQQNDQPLLPSYASWLALNYITTLVIFATPLILTYVALSRRLMDIGFVLNRAVVFGIVSTIVVGAFVLVEWVAGEWFVNTSHTTSAVAGMVVALALGFSMRYIHTYVDRFVDGVFFRKRHEDEAALRRFAHEAAYVTDRSLLLERAVGEVLAHTDAQDASILVRDEPATYVSGGHDNGRLSAIGENDPGIIALRAWHKPVDLHEVSDSELHGELAFPMISRGELVGALICGPKRDGEAYAPDETDALLMLSQGVGTALDTLSSRGDAGEASLREMLVRILDKLDALPSSGVSSRQKGTPNDYG
jgi:hypothetical protein